MKLTLKTTGKQHRVDYDSWRDKDMLKNRLTHKVVTKCGLVFPTIRWQAAKQGDAHCRRCDHG